MSVQCVPTRSSSEVGRPPPQDLPYPHVHFIIWLPSHPPDVYSTRIIHQAHFQDTLSSPPCYFSSSKHSYPQSWGRDSGSHLPAPP